MAIPTDVTTQLHTLALKARRAGRRGSLVVLEIGRLASTAKGLTEEFGNGSDFAAWIKQSQIPRSEVYRSLKIHDHFGEVASADKQPRTVLMILSRSPEACKRATPRIEKGERLSIADARRLVAGSNGKEIRKREAASTVRRFETPTGVIGIRLEIPNATEEEIQQAMAHALRQITPSTASRWGLKKERHEDRREAA